MAMPQCCYLAKGAKRPSHTTNTIKFDRIAFDPCHSIKRFDLCPFDQKNSNCLQPPETIKEAIDEHKAVPTKNVIHWVATFAGLKRPGGEKLLKMPTKQSKKDKERTVSSSEQSAQCGFCTNAVLMGTCAVECLACEQKFHQVCSDLSEVNTKP